ncbi:unnamed protein product [Macrosiphum euphorbiae]|uniref:Uncharacterized protein n=1 Tax=Macrosiphum euphorbiae TaxID=13131 RepID=A0AAV0WRJ3_9HEMI|nr:unnamed protein product [Macrosiphum euphorbiae]
MSKLNKSLVCLCGKQKSNLNDTNWKRHISACKIVVERSQVSKSISTFFVKKRDNLLARHQHQEKVKEKKAHNVDRTTNKNSIGVHVTEAEEIANLELPSMEANEYADVILEVLQDDVAELEDCYEDHTTNEVEKNIKNIISEKVLNTDVTMIEDLFNDENTTNKTVNDYGHISNDPVSFCRSRPFSHDVIEYLIKKGPFQPTEDDLVNCEFPKDNSGRSFHASWYWKDVPGCAPVKLQCILAPVNQIFQKSDLDLLAAVNCIEETRESIRKLRCNTVFMDIVKEMEYFESSSTFCFTKLKESRIRGKKLMPGETSQDDSIQDPLHNIKKRLKEVFNNTSKLPTDAFYNFAKIYNSFINQNELIKEYLHFSKVYFNFELTSNLPKTFHENNLESYDSQDDCDSEDFENIEDENSKEKNNLSSISTVYDVFVAGDIKCDTNAIINKFASHGNLINEFNA